MHGGEERTPSAHTWTGTVEADMKSTCNIDLFSAWHQVNNRQACSRLVRTAKWGPLLMMMLDSGAAVVNRCN